MAPALLPHVAGRPLTVRRFPDGVEGPSFYEKHLPRGTPDWVRRVTLAPSPRSTSAEIEFVVIDGPATLVWLANLAALELHVPMWRVDAQGRPTPPDLMVFDLDPGAPATVVECAQVAVELAGLLADEHGLTAFPKSSGSKGLQLYVTLPKKLRGTWDNGATAAEARRLATLCARRRPELVVANIRKDQRVGRVLSTGARTTWPRPRWPRTRCGPGPSRRCPPRSPGTRWPAPRRVETAPPWPSCPTRCASGSSAG